MIEKGLVISVKDGEALVSFVPTDKCASCCGCSAGKDSSSMQMSIKTEKKVLPGDTVSVEVNPRALLSSAFMVFLLPLIMFIVGTLIAVAVLDRTNLLVNKNTVGMIAGFTMMIITFFLQVIIYIPLVFY